MTATRVALIGISEDDDPLRGDDLVSMMLSAATASRLIAFGWGRFLRASTRSYVRTSLRDYPCKVALGQELVSDKALAGASRRYEHVLYRRLAPCRSPGPAASPLPLTQTGDSVRVVIIPATPAVIKPPESFR